MENMKHTEQQINIKIMNNITLLEFINRLSSTPEKFDKEGKNKAAVHEVIHKIPPQFKAEILFNLFDTLVQICKPTKALIWKGIGIHVAISAGTFSTSST